MNKRIYRVLFVTSMMIFTSLAGCIESSDSDEEDIVIEPEAEYYGKIMTSTYHVEQLVSNIVGDTATVEMMSTTNTPVHDYNPSLIDIERLKSSDAFFYHGLGLEPWVDRVLASEGVPPSYQTHTMPTGEITLDYQTMLENDLCEQLSSGDKVSNDLLSYEDQAGQLEIHLDKGVQTLTLPPADTSHDGHDHDDHSDENGHDDHEGHDDHDAHDEHAHLKPEKVITDPANCPVNTVVSVFHLEEGEHVVEFETNWWARTSFDMAALPMMGGHAHHHHGHGDGPFEWAGIFAMNDATHTWSMQKVGGAYADPTMRLVLIPTATPDEATMHSLEGGVEALIEGDCIIVEDTETMQNIADTGTCFELHVGTGDDSSFNMDTTGLAGLAIYAQHVPTEFERDQHYLKDSTGEDIEPVAQEGGGDHGHHDDHGDHDDHADNEPYCHTPDHVNTDHTDRTSCEAAGNIWMAGEPNDGTRGYLTIHVENEGDYGFAVPSDISVYILMGEGHEGHDHGGHDDHSGHDDHGDHDEETHGLAILFPDETSMVFETDHDDAIVSGWNLTEVALTTNSIPYTAEHSEFGAMIVDINGSTAPESDDDDYWWWGVHVWNESEESWDFSSVGLSSIMLEDSPHVALAASNADASLIPSPEDDHDETHSGDESTESGESTIVAEEGEDEFEYDPHSWLDPISFKAQTQLVLSALIDLFPNGTDTFTANAEAFMAELDKVHLGYVGAFGPEGTCTNKTAAANHNAYSYITKRYGVEFVTVHGLDPEGQPSVEDIEKVISKIKEDEINVLFIEEYTQASSVDNIVEETNVEVRYLYTMEKQPSDANDDYLSMLNKNLDHLKKGLGCAE